MMRRNGRTRRRTTMTAMMMMTAVAMKTQRSVVRSILAKTMSRGHPTTTTRRKRTKLSRLYISLFILSISLQTVSNIYSTEIFYIIANRLVCWTVCPDKHTIHQKRPYGLSIMIAHNSDYRPICRVSHTSCYTESFVFTSIITNGSSERTVCHISHTPWSGCPFLLFWLITNSLSKWTICHISHTPSSGCPLLFCLIANS